MRWGPGAWSKSLRRQFVYGIAGPKAEVKRIDGVTLDVLCEVLKAEPGDLLTPVAGTSGQRTEQGIRMRHAGQYDGPPHRPSTDPRRLLRVLPDGSRRPCYASRRRQA